MSVSGWGAREPCLACGRDRSVGDTVGPQHPRRKALCSSNHSDWGDTRPTQLMGTRCVIGWPFGQHQPAEAAGCDARARAPPRKCLTNPVSSTGWATWWLCPSCQQNAWARPRSLALLPQALRGKRSQLLSEGQGRSTWSSQQSDASFRGT